MLYDVDVPEDVGLTIAKEYAVATKPAKRNNGKKPLPKHIPVVATSNNRSTRTTLVPSWCWTLSPPGKRHTPQSRPRRHRRPHRRLAQNRSRIPRPARSSRTRSRPQVSPPPQKRIQPPHHSRPHAIPALVLSKVPQSPQKTPPPSPRNPHRASRLPQTKIPQEIIRPPRAQHRQPPRRRSSSWAFPISLSPCLPVFLPLSLIRQRHASIRHSQHRTDFSPPPALRRRPGRSSKTFPNTLPHHPRHRRPHPQLLPSRTARGSQPRHGLPRHSSPAAVFIRIHHVLARFQLQPR